MKRIVLMTLMTLTACGGTDVAGGLDDGLHVVLVMEDAGVDDGQCTDPRECYVPDPTNPCGRGTEDREACRALHDAGVR